MRIVCRKESVGFNQIAQVGLMECTFFFFKEFIDFVKLVGLETKIRQS